MVRDRIAKSAQEVDARVDCLVMEIGLLGILLIVILVVVLLR